MDNPFSLQMMQPQLTETVRELTLCNQTTAQFGLSLTEDQMIHLARRRVLALQDNRRVEFGGGILKKLIEAFCDSPYLSQYEYENVLLELQDIFYYFKNESMDRISDDELIEAMCSFWNEQARGSLDYLSGTSLEALCRAARGGTGMDEQVMQLWEVDDEQ